MANWDKLTGRGNVEDRRGMAPVALGGLGGVGAVVILLLNLFGHPNAASNVGSVLNQLKSAQGQRQSADSGKFAGVDDYEKFASTVLGSSNDTWKTIFSQAGKTYAEPKLVLFRTATASACGGADSQAGPHYCPNDQTIYLDETFFDELKKLGGGNGDVAQAYVITHEVGHHVQNQLGTLQKAQATGGSSSKNSVALELQADCFAGIWAYSVNQQGVFGPGEITQAVNAAAAVGDDRIQKATSGRVNPETFTHGSSTQRVSWFNQGYASGKPADCNTF